jgi:hypothetical protein
MVCVYVEINLGIVRLPVSETKIGRDWDDPIDYG